MAAVCRLFYLLLLSTFVALSGCDQSQSTSEKSPPQQTSVEDKQVLLALFPQKVSDSGWNQAGFTGVQTLSNELELNFIYLESVPFIDYEAFSALVRQQIEVNNVDIVMAHGGQYIDPVSRLARNFPRVNFIVNTNCPGNNANMGCLSFDWRELGLLTGTLAALKSETGKIGFIGGMQLPILEQMATGMRVGALDINPDVQLFEHYLTSWTDEVQAMAIAEQMLADGVDVISVNADPASRVIYPLLEKKGVAVIGRQLENYDSPPSTLLANVQLYTPRLIQYGFNQILKGRWQGKLYQFGIKDQVQEIHLEPKALTPEQAQEFKQVYQKVVLGHLEVER